MKQKTYIWRSLVAPLCVLAMLCFASSAWALGINFSVLTGASGQGGTGVNATGGDGADIYVGGGGNNVVRIPKAALGLQPGDEVDAISIIDPTTPLLDEVLFMGLFLFSVDANAVGLAGAPPDVASEAALSEAAGDIFAAQGWGWGVPGNFQVIDESVLGLVGPGAPEDDQDALDVEAPLLSYPLPLFSVIFSLAAGSPSLAPGITEDDLLTPNGAGGFIVAYPGALLGIPPGDDLDALFVDPTPLPVFSVAGGSGLLNPGDLLVPDGGWGGWGSPAGDGLADVLVPAWWLGLAPTDNVNALDAILDMMPPEDPETVDTDGDGLPDYWEEREKLDPNDDGSTDPDMGADGDPDGDGWTNKEEYDNGTDPWVPDPGGLSVMRPWPVSVGVALAVIALAAVALVYRRRVA